MFLQKSTYTYHAYIILLKNHVDFVLLSYNFEVTFYHKLNCIYEIPGSTSALSQVVWVSDDGIRKKSATHIRLFVSHYQKHVNPKSYQVVIYPFVHEVIVRYFPNIKFSEDDEHDEGGRGSGFVLFVFG